MFYEIEPTGFVSPKLYVSKQSLGEQEMLLVLDKTHNVCYYSLKYKRTLMTASLNQKTRTNVYLDTNMKKQAQEKFKQYGMGLSDAFNIFLSQSVMEKGIPFQIKIPNDETKKVIKDARENKNMTKVSLDELKEVLGA
jgi:DNA-damage-inducible protein J